MESSMERNRGRIRDLLLQTGREGIADLLNWMNHDSDFYTAPCSTEFHLAVEGGLARHSLNVYELLEAKIRQYGFGQSIEPSSIIICGLCHDLCKANFYERGKKNVKENGAWREKEIWVVKDQFPYGHGEKSVSILQDFICLTDEEKCAIRWHMVAFDPGIHFSYPSGYPFRTAAKMYPLLTLLFTADFEASNIIEATGYESIGTPGGGIG